MSRPWRGQSPGGAQDALDSRTGRCRLRHGGWKRFFRLLPVWLAVTFSATGCANDPVGRAESEAPAEPVSTTGPVLADFDADRAFGYLETICDLGPRISGTEAMFRQQELIARHFTNLGVEVRTQDFDAPHPETGRPVRLRNLIVSWHPESTERVIICTHYDTRPRPDQEPYPPHRDEPFIGANDGGSGVALLMELGHHMPTLQPTYGVDFVFFDAEELVYDNERDRNRYFLGSTYFAKTYRDNPPQYRYVAAVLLDMVGSKDFRAYYESNSLRFAPELTRSVWEAARKAGVREFIPRRKHEVRDDHLPLNQIALIPACDVIDFDYPYWHRRNDIPAACSGETLKKVARVVATWLEDVPKIPPVRNVR